MSPSKENAATNRATLILYENRSIPLYRMVKEELIRFLQKKGIKSGMALPSEKELSMQFDVSVGTVRRAIAELVTERIVIRQQGRGTFLAPYDSTRLLNPFWHIERRDGQVDIPTVTTLAFSLTGAQDTIARQLQIAPGQPVFRIDNLMTMRGQPVLVDTLYLPAHLFEGLSLTRLSARDATLYDFYREQYGINIVRTIDRCSGAVADENTAKRLKRKLGSSLLEVRRLAYSFGDKPVEYRRSLLGSENHEYVDVTGGDMSRFS